ncbi:DUF3955 domain-containing protein [Ligilactobacillus hohenheimensis]|uniref:DUF3955 domain-containing protein n=1 Tax=Ligilactobacillus hohenheimensis TaxID=2991832 RepID=UPI001F8A6A85|nr:hypothetical protein [Ligilactobacillus hohenheimensis]HJC03304.1 DUF3955 domain-containing protein [Candidatus Ligilactobacillus avistercoris]
MRKYTLPVVLLILSVIIPWTVNMFTTIGVNGTINKPHWISWTASALLILAAIITAVMIHKHNK